MSIGRLRSEVLCRNRTPENTTENSPDLASDFEIHAFSVKRNTIQYSFT